MDNFIRYTQFSVKANQVVFYPTNLTGSRKFNFIHFDEDLVGKKTYRGDMTPSGIKLIYKRISLFERSVQFWNKELRFKLTEPKKQLVLVTLTLSSKQVHDDQFIKRILLKSFIDKCKQSYSLVNYIWKAEVQTNGNIHFHILWDIYIDKHYVQDIWNSIQSEWGYTDEYVAKHGHNFAPSTDIHMCRSTSKTIRYMAKYLCKSTGSRKIDGAIWRCSDNLLHLTDYMDAVDSNLEYHLNELVKENKVKTFENEHIKSYIFDHNITPDDLPPYQQTGYFDHLLIQTSQFYGRKLEPVDEIESEGDFQAALFHPYPLQICLFDEETMKWLAANEVASRELERLKY
jgi:hypothetical protein